MNLRDLLRMIQLKWQFLRDLLRVDSKEMGFITLCFIKYFIEYPRVFKNFQLNHF